MTDVLSFTLPWPPSVNHCWSHVTKGGRSWAYLTEEAEKYKEAAQEITWAALQWQKWQVPEKEKRVKNPILLVVELRYFSPDWRQDCDNGLKLMLDSISKGIGYDDRFFLPRVMSREIDRENPRVEMRVYREER